MLKPHLVRRPYFLTKKATETNAAIRTVTTNAAMRKFLDPLYS
jgi:hypothetical protein